MSDPERNLVQRAAAYAVEYFEWLRDSLASEAARQAMLADLGLDPASPSTLSIPDEQLDSIDRYRQQSDVDFEAFLSTWGDLITILEAVDAFVSTAGAGGEEAVKEATYQLLQVTATDYMRLRHPFFFFLARLLGVFASNPPEHLQRAIDKLETDDDAEVLARSTLLPLAFLVAFWEKSAQPLLKLFGAEYELPARVQLYGWDVPPNSPTPVADQLARRMYSLKFTGKRTEQQNGQPASVEVSLGVSLAWVPAEQGGPGLFVALHGSDEIVAPLSKDWRLKVTFASSGAVDFLIWDAVTVNGPSDASASVSIDTTHKPDEPPYTFAIARGTRLEVGKLSISAQLGASGASIKAVARDSALVLSMRDGDAFVEQTIPSGEVRFDFDLGVGLASGRGLFLEGGSGVQLALPLNRSIGPVRLRQIYMALSGGKSGSAVEYEASFAIEARFGPVTAVLDRVGFVVKGDSRDREPPTIGYKAPAGVGLLIDSAPVIGSGYLFYDPSSESYAGAVQLDINGLTLQAIGLITTRMPDGARGFSMLVIVSVADFTPINLGLGFRLTGVGGLLGINRTADVEALRNGLKNGSLDAILFPENPVADAPRIVTTLQAVMPPRDGQFLAGPAARITWGVPTVLTIDLAIVLELPSPARLLVLGQFRALLPTEEEVLVRLQMDALGVIDFDRGTVAIDATLYDSRVLTHAITGDMALRARWSNDPIFLLAVGGFNPNFTAPANFPQLGRVAMTLTKGDRARLRMESYYALTSNTAQVGSRLELLVRAGSFSVDGHLGFDALFRFSPFRFIVDIEAGVTLKWRGRTLLGVTLELTLAGPSPWHAHGKATFKVWRFSKSVSFDRTFGADEAAPALPPVDPLPELIAALRDPRNWAAQAPTTGPALVSLRELPATGDLLVHPLGDLSVRQRVVPLGITIDRFGNTTPSGDRRFTIGAVALGDARPDDLVPVFDYFAPAQFIEISDSDKLRRPSFELMEAGLRIGGGLSYGGQNDPALIGEATLEYEVAGPEAPPGAREVAVYDVAVEELAAVVALDRQRAPLQRTGRARYAAPGAQIAVPEPRYLVVSSTDLAPVSLPELNGGVRSYTAAAQALWRHLERQPALRGSLQVVSTFDIEGSNA